MAFDDPGDSETVPESEAPPSETAESPETGVVPAESKPRRSLEAWFKARENILKGTAVIISVCAVLATGASATAAWFSWETANRSADAAEHSADTALKALDTARQARDISDQMRAIAQAQYETAGANMQARGYLNLRGTCGDAADPLLGRIEIENAGRLSGEVLGVSFGLLLPPGEVDGPYTNNPTFVPIGRTERTIEIGPQRRAEIEMPVECARLSESGINLVNAGKEIEQRINAGSEYWRIWPSYAVYSPVYDQYDGKIWNAYYCRKIDDQACP